jgi:hypothetical protein
VTPGTPSEAESELAAGIDNVSSRPAAAFVILAREKDLIPILESIRQMEGMEKDKPRPCTGVLAHTSARGTLPFSRSLQSQAPLRKTSRPRRRHSRAAECCSVAYPKPNGAKCQISLIKIGQPKPGQIWRRSMCCTETR